MPARAEFIRATGDFLRQMNPSGPQAFGPDDDLFTLGLVDSLRLVELIVFMEELTGREIPVEDYSIASFYTLNNLYALVSDGAMRSGASGDG
jgi:methoxymalonate biosynthesis acyl carrier protein